MESVIGLARHVVNKELCHVNDRIETDLLAEMIDKKHDVLAALRELSRRQAEIISEGDFTKLLSVLAAKQKLLDELQAIERLLDPFREQDPDHRVWRSAADRERCRQAAQRCEALLREILVVEKRGEADLVYRRDQAAAKLHGVHVASEARTAYTNVSEPTFGKLDLTSQS